MPLSLYSDRLAPHVHAPGQDGCIYLSEMHDDVGVGVCRDILLELPGSENVRRTRANTRCHQGERDACGFTRPLQWFVYVLCTDRRHVCSCSIMLDYFVGSTSFIHSNEISIADLLAACELSQLRVIGFDAAQGTAGRAYKWHACDHYDGV